MVTLMCSCECRWCFCTKSCLRERKVAEAFGLEIELSNARAPGTAFSSEASRDGCFDIGYRRRWSSCLSMARLEESEGRRRRPWSVRFVRMSACRREPGEASGEFGRHLAGAFFPSKKKVVSFLCGSLFFVFFVFPPHRYRASDAGGRSRHGLEHRRPDHVPARAHDCE